MATRRASGDVNISLEKEVVSSHAKTGDALDRTAKIWLVVSVLIGAVLAIILHAVVGSVVVVANELEFGPLGRTFGPEAVASVWALLAFSGSAYVFYLFHHRIRGDRWERGLRYGGAIGLLWLVGMLEGVSLFGNPFINEFLVGLSDAIPILIMGIMLSVLVFQSGAIGSVRVGQLRPILALAAISVVYLAGRSIAYLTGFISSGHSDFPMATILWTFGMGMTVGIAFLLLWDAALSQATGRAAINFGVLIFGINWFVFLVFIPMLFEGTFSDIMLRVGIDIIAVVLGSYLALRWWYRGE